MNKDIAILREVVGKLTQMIAGMGLRVTQQGAQAFVRADKDGKPNHVNIPHIPDNAGEDLILAIQGFIDHEVAHIFFTEFPLIGIAAKKGGPSLASLLNIVEDPRIETCMGKRFPGAKLNIERLHQFFFDRVTKPGFKGAKSIEEAFGYLIVPIVRAWSGQQTFDRLLADAGYWDHPLVKAFVAAVPDATKKRCQMLTSTRDAMVMAEELHAILHPPAPPQPKAQPQKGDKGDKSDQPSNSKDKGEKSDGKGSNQSKPEDDEDQGSKGEKDQNDEADASEDDGDQDESEASDKGASEDSGEGKTDQKNEADDERGDGADDLDKDGAESDEEKDGGKSQGEDEESADSDAENADSNADDPDKAEEKEADAKAEPSKNDEDENDANDDEGGDIGSSSDLDEDESDGGDAGKGQAEAGDGSSDGDLDSESDEGDPDETMKVKPPEKDSTIAPQGGDNAFQKIEIEIQDFDGSITAIIADQAARDCRDADYLVYTTDWDDISTPKVDAAHYKDEMLVKLDGKTGHMVGPMQKEIERMMAARAQVQNVAGYRSGRLHSAGLYRLRVGDDRIFRRRFEAKAKETAVTLLIDNSGSMWGEKMRTAMSAGYALSQTLERVGIPYEVIGFTTGYTDKLPKNWHNDVAAEASRIGRAYSRACPIIMPIFKDFNERLTPEIKRRFAYYAEAQPDMGANVDGESLAIAGKRLLKRKEQRKVILVLSDGHPAGDGPAHEGYSNLHATVASLTKSRVEVIGIGIMDSSVKTFYPRSMVLNNLKELPKAVMGELRRILLSE